MDTESERADRLRLVPGAKGARPARGVRASRVQRARERIASGYYDRQDVREKVVGALLGELTRE